MQAKKNIYKKSMMELLITLFGYNYSSYFFSLLSCKSLGQIYNGHYLVALYTYYTHYNYYDHPEWNYPITKTCVSCIYTVKGTGWKCKMQMC